MICQQGKRQLLGTVHVCGLRQSASTMDNAPEKVMGFASASDGCGW